MKWAGGSGENRTTDRSLRVAVGVQTAKGLGKAMLKLDIRWRPHVTGSALIAIKNYI